MNNILLFPMWILGVLGEYSVLNRTEIIDSVPGNFLEKVQWTRYTKSTVWTMFGALFQPKDYVIYCF